MDRLPSHLILLHLLGATGFAVVVTMGLVTAPVRDLWAKIFRRFPVWSKLLFCAMCFGVWAGGAWGSLLLIRGRLGMLSLVHDALSFAFAVSLLGFMVVLVDTAVGRIGQHKGE